VSYLLIEVTVRLFLSVNFKVPIFEYSNPIGQYYPELAKAEEYQYDENKTNLLVLGGSVVYDGTIIQELNGQTIETSFCDFTSLLPSEEFNVLSVAAPGHNSLDSWYKYDFLKDEKFDVVFVYHGINDTRTNNIRENMFDVDYRHIEFYDDLWIVRNSGYQRRSRIPFTVKWIAHSMRKFRKKYIPREFFYGLLAGEPEPYLQEGKFIKSTASFKRNLNYIYVMSKSKGEQFVMGTFAWHLPDDYSYDKFKNKELDYDQQLYPTELYGLAINVERGLIAHNKVIRELFSQEPAINIIAANEIIPKNGEHFDDVCHLNQLGCSILGSQLLDVVKISHSK